MTVLVTGVAGFIGSNLVEYLLNKEFTVVGIDNFAPYYAKKLKLHNLTTIPQSKNFIFIEADLTNPEQMKTKVFEKYSIQAIVNLAGWAGVTECHKQPLTYVFNNTYGVVNLLELAKDFGIYKFLQAGTSSQYGDTPIPWDEKTQTTTPPQVYAASKASAELFGYSYYRNYGINFTAMRFFNVYGPRQRPEMALPMLFKSHLLKRAFPQYQDLNKTGRDYTYVKDICDGIYKILQKELGYQQINLGNGSPQTLKHLIEATEAVIGHKIILKRMEERIGEAEVTFCDNTKAKELVGFEPKYDINSGVKEQYEWFIKQPDWYKFEQY